MTESIILSLADDDRLEELRELNKSLHSIDDRFCDRVFLRNPASNRPEYHRFLLEDDRLVAGTSLLRHVVSWYGSKIEIGEIGLVGTYEEHRCKGYATTLMNDWIETMQREGIPFCFLWGIPDFYERFHFYYAYPHHMTPYVSLPKSCTEDWERVGTIREAEIGDRWWVKKLYRAYNADLNGCQVRSDEQWEHYFKVTEEEELCRWWVPEDPMGGYALVCGDPPKVWEIASPSLNSARNLVLGLFEAYPGIDRLDICHHPDMPVGSWLYHLGARIASPEDIWKGTWGGMVRIIDPLPLLKGMEDRFDERLAKSRFHNWSGAIALESEVGGAAFDIVKGKTSISELDRKADFMIPARALTPMMTGYRGFERFRAEPKDIPDDTVEVLGVLFQRDKVFMYPLLYIDEGFPRVH